MRTFGTVAYDATKREYVIDAEPHIVLRLKRVFGKVNRRAHGALRLSDTIETSRELAWFLERYPMKVENRRHLDRRAREHRDREDAIASLLSGKIAPRTFDLAVPLREYQQRAAAIVLKGGGLLLADDVGIGKTATAIGTFADLRTLPALVVTLTHLPRQWQAEINRFAPKLRVHILKKATPYDLRNGAPKKQTGQLALVDPEMPDVIIANYHKLAGWASVLAPLCKSVVFDEIQELRHRGTDKYDAAIHIAHAAQFRTGLSATPVYNLGGEIWSILNVLHPDTLGSFDEFAEEWCGAVDQRGRASLKDPKAFGTYAREAGLMLRRTRTDVGRELPPVTKVPHHVDADVGELNKIESSAAELARVILKQGQAFRHEKLQASEEFSMRLRQATGLAKAPFVADFVRLLLEQGERKVVLYGWHRAVYELWMDRLKDLAPVLYTGSESATQKEAAKRTFVEGQSQVMIISLRAGAGLDGLQHICRTVVFGELDWSPGVHEQCLGRIARDGQEQPVLAYFLISDHGADPVIADVLQLKQAQSDGLRDPKADLLESLDIGTGNVKRLAEDFLRQRGLSVPETVNAEAS